MLGVVAARTVGVTSKPKACASHRSAPGVNVNRLLRSGLGSFEPLSNMADMTGVPVQVERINKKGTSPRRHRGTENLLFGWEIRGLVNSFLVTFSHLEGSVSDLYSPRSGASVVKNFPSHQG